MSARGNEARRIGSAASGGENSALNARSCRFLGFLATLRGYACAWLTQVGRNLTDACDGFLRDARYLIVDRDPLYTASFKQTLEAAGVSVVRTPPSSPNLNAFAERWVLSARSELLDRVVILGEAHLRRLLAEWTRHYHRERHHQGLGGRLIEPDDTAGRTQGPVRCRERLGGLLRHYYREPEAA